MRTYSKKRDFINRLKLAGIILIIAYAVSLLSACSDEEEPDLIPGKWGYSNTDFSVEFELERRGNTYYANKIQVNEEEWKLYQINEVEAGRQIGYIGIKSLDDTDGVVFINSVLTQDGNDLLSDTVVYITGGNQNVKYYYNQVLKKK